MKLRHLLLSILLLGMTVVAFSDDYVDDVYFWQNEEPVSSSPFRDAAETQPRANEEASSVQITFVEDSITQHSDTVVKAVIRR